MQENVSFEFWPVNSEGAWPYHAFPDAFLKEAFFSSLPRMADCSTLVVRKALKVFLKRVIPNYRKLNSDFSAETAFDQDRSLIRALCDSPRARSKFAELSLQKERVSSIFGRSRASVARIRPGQDIATLLWSTIVTDPDNAAVARWIREICGASDDSGSPYFLTADRLRDAGSPADWPCDPRSDLFARIILLMGAKLSPEAARDLFTVAADLGNECFAGGRALVSDDLPVEAPDPKPGNARPRLEVFERDVTDQFLEPGPTEQSLELLEAFEKAEGELAHSSSELRVIERVEIGELVNADDSMFEERVSVMRSHRGYRAEYTSAKTEVALRSAELRGRAQEIIGRPIDGGGSDPVSDLVTADMQLSLARIGASSPMALQRWSDSAEKGGVGTEDLKNLAMQALSEESRRATRSAFVGELFRFIARETGPAAVGSWLREIEQAELAAFCVEICGEQWLPLKAILLRLVTEAGSGYDKLVEDELARQASENRREALRFCDSTASSLDGSVAVKRLIALERFRDALVFGPIAQVSDPAAGLSDVDTVGKTVHELSELLTEHLDLIGSNDDLRNLLVSSDGTAEPIAEFREFARTPVAMTGIYKKLREVARERIFLPLSSQSELPARIIRETLNELRSGETLEEIIATVSRDGLLRSVEARHRTQLERYLSQGASLIERLQAGQPRETNPRRASLRTRLQKLLGQFRSGGSFGSIEWFEGEIRAALVGKNRPDHPTLLGNSQSFLEREWTEQDSQWARSYVEIPELYDDLEMTGLEITSAFVWWSCQPDLPSRARIVETLTEAGRYASALAALDEFGDMPERQSLLSFLRDETRPQQLEARERAASLKARCEALGISDDALSIIESSIEDLDFDGARERSDDLELALIDAEAALHVEAEDEVERGKRDRLARMLLKAGVPVEDRTPLYDLEMRWAGELKTRSPNREHILLAQTVLANARHISTRFAADIDSFNEKTEDPETWLPEKACGLFAEMLQPSVQKLRTWIDSYPVYSTAAQSALLRLLDWYLKFFIENALTVNASGDEPIDGPLERVFEVSDVIGSSAEPISCVARLTEIGEALLEASPVVDDEPEANDDETEAEQSIAGEANVNQAPADVPPKGDAPPDLGEWIIRDQWAEVLHGVTASEWEDADKFAELARLMLAQQKGSGGPISKEVAELASAISSDNMRFVTRATRMEIAYRIVAAALDVTKKTEGSTWSEALGQRPDIMRVISGLSGTSRRALENLLKGNLGPDIAERLWETATNTADPQVIRTPLLLWLYERCSPELVLKLAHKHEPTLKDRLEQLFEIRSVAISRPDLVPVAQSLAAQISQQAKTAPFRNFVRGLPTAQAAEQPKLIVTTDDQIIPRGRNDGGLSVDISVTVEPRGLVPEVLSVSLFQDDDVTFADGTRRMDLTKQPLYFATDYLLQVKLGNSWAQSTVPERELLRLRVGAKTLTGDLIQTDVGCQVFRRDRNRSSGHSLDNTSLWEIYPGVGNQPARDDEFIGRVAELEQLRTVLVSAKKPTPVLLTGMRRVGKTSLLHEFHKSYRQPNQTDAVTVYLSLAEKRAALKEKGKDVSAIVFSTIVKVLAKRLTANDPNNEVIARLQAKLACDWQAVRKHLQACYDQESFADSLVFLSEKLLEWTGGVCKRVVYLIDEAETLVVPYQEGGTKRAELEQFLQSLREVSQSSESVGIVLSGSNHIDVFAREYKNAFFGSCLPINLRGLDNLADCEHIIAPQRVRPYVEFDQSAIQYAAEISAGMPLFMWQLGAATAALVRSGPARRTDVRRAVQALVFDDGSLPFKAYEILEPLEHMLGLRPQPEPDLLWLLLYRVARSTSLVAPEANSGFIIDQTLLSVRDKDVWRQYLVSLTEIGILEIPRTGEYRFKIPIFAEGFRARKQWSEFTLRHQRATI